MSEQRVSLSGRVKRKRGTSAAAVLPLLNSTLGTALLIVRRNKDSFWMIPMDGTDASRLICGLRRFDKTVTDLGVIYACTEVDELPRLKAINQRLAVQGIGVVVSSAPVEKDEAVLEAEAARQALFARAMKAFASDAAGGRGETR